MTKIIILKGKKDSGRERKTSNNDDNIIVDMIENNDDLSLFDIKNELEKYNILISTPTIYRRLIENKYVYKFPTKKPFLTEDHKKKDYNGL